jgi:hypothetical protein
MIHRRLLNIAFFTSTALFAAVVLLWIESYMKNWNGELNWPRAGTTDYVTLSAEPGRMTLTFRREDIVRRQGRYRFDTYDIDPSGVSPSDWAYNSKDTAWRSQFLDFRYYVMTPNYGGPPVNVHAIDIPAWFLAAVTGVAAFATYYLRRTRVPRVCHACGEELARRTDGVCPACGVTADVSQRTIA